ncbi:phosphopentomutase [Paenibacillus athensensis]|uniref:Phosphopentomutase n=1 Tax=Paenibacillus athensensis TaxID=1967502 RepID=A0A4Y8PZZ5_9BACL|nr:phosphopentomutase [Paenibacillus athensensis]MCD1260442.1 phosphopentomutase [Paenibacillus athensensis]
MSEYQRVFLIVLDSVGIGALPDAERYQDEGAHTLGHIAAAVGGLDLPNLTELGLGRIAPIQGVAEVSAPMAHYGKMNELSVGKDTTTGHWELMGLQVETPFQTYPDGFPDALMQELSARIGRGILGNKPASGTDILDEFGGLHMTSGDVIVYTSADSVLQVAAHEDIVPLEELYRICRIARELTLTEPNFVGRVIARPFVGRPGAWERTAGRKDYSVKPHGPTVMNALADAGHACIAIGKISDIYDGEGVTLSHTTKSNMDGVDRLLQTMDTDFTGLCFTNLVDFDAKYGHRRDPQGYAAALRDFDARLPAILDKLRSGDLLILTADHGNDPTHPGTDHTREYVPVLVFRRGLAAGRSLGVRDTFADVGATIADNFRVRLPQIGTSFLQQL